MLQGYIPNSESICGVKVVAGNVNEPTGVKEVRGVRISVPAVCEVLVADDDTDHKVLPYQREKYRVWSKLKGLWVVLRQRKNHSFSIE